MEENLQKNEKLITSGELLKLCYLYSLKLFSNILKKIIKNLNINEKIKIQKITIIINTLKEIELIVNNLGYLDKILFEFYLILKKLLKNIQKESAQNPDNLDKQNNIIKNLKTLGIITLKLLILIPTIISKLTLFLEEIINSIKKDISSFLYVDFIIIKNTLNSIKQSHKELIKINLKEIDKLNKISK